MGEIFESKPSYQKGLIGEEIVKKYLEYQGYLVSRPKDTAKSGASLIDFVAKHTIQGDESFVEVKIKSPSSYAYRFPAYMFPKSQIDSYISYAKEKDKDSMIFVYIVDEKRENIYFGYLCEHGGIEEPLKIEDKTFPLDVEQSNGMGMYRVYSIKQFHYVDKIDFTDLERLRSIKFSDKEKKFLKPLYKSEDNISTEKLLDDSRAVIKKYLNLKLPDDIPAKSKKISVLVNSLRQKLEQIPTYLFYEIYHAVHNLNMEKEMAAFVSKFYPLLDEIRHARQKTSYEKPDYIEIKNPAKKVAELRTSNNSLLEIFEVNGNEPNFFIGKRKLASIFRDKSCRYLSYEFSDSVKAVSKFYSLYGISNYSDGTLAVAVKDVKSILEDYSFNRVNGIVEYDTAKKFLSWWEKASEPYIEQESIQEDKISSESTSFNAEVIQEIGKIANSIMEVMGTTRQNALHAAVKIKSRELNLDLTPLIELLK